MSAFRSLSKHARTLSRTAPARPSTARAFHSPFVSLSSPLSSPPSPTSHASPLYEKQLDHSPDPQVSSAGTRTYVVSEPDPANTPYAVPSGAYPTSAPYQNFPAAEAPVAEGAQHASTSPGFAHPIAARAPQNESGVTGSAAVRHSDAPGEMGARGGGHGGLGMMDKAGTKAGVGELAERNPPPLFEHAEKFSKAGLDHAWKERK